MTIDDIKERREKITPGPWEVSELSTQVDTTASFEVDRVRSHRGPRNNHICVLSDYEYCEYLDQDEQKANVQFIANAPADIDWLVADRERFNKALGDAVTAHCTCGGGSPDDGCAACKVYHEIIEQTQGEK